MNFLNEKCYLVPIASTFCELKVKMTQRHYELPCSNPIALMDVEPIIQKIVVLDVLM